MSAAATAAGYLYASGRLRGRKEGEEGATRSETREHKPARTREDMAAKRRPLRVAALPSEEYFEEPKPAARPRAAVKVEYRTRRWRPGGPVE